MAKKAATEKEYKQKHKNGLTVWFKGYDGDGKGDLVKGDKLKITGFDKKEDLYNVKRDGDGKVDSLFDNEFSLKEVVKDKTEAAPAKKQAKTEPAPAKKQAKAEVKPKAEVKAKAKDEEEEELPEFVSTPSVTAAIKDAGGELKAAAKLSEVKEKTVFTLGGVLAKIKRGNLFREIKVKDEESGKMVPAYDEGLAGFNAYVKDKLGMESRSADYYVKMYEMFSQVTTEAQIGKVGWTKLRELLPLKNVITEKNVETWLEKAKNEPAEALHDSVTKALVKAGEKIHGNRGGGTGPTAEQHAYKFVVHNDQCKTVDGAIQKAKDIMGDGTSDGAALVHILSEWLDGQGSEGK